MKLIEMLSRSEVTASFKDAVQNFLASGRANEQLAFSSGCPPVKIERTLIKVLESYGHLPIASVHIDGRSGCEYFRGELTLRTVAEERSVHFNWDCKWKATELGWTDYFGFPDQMRAAREFGYECFRSWKEQAVRRFADA